MTRRATGVGAPAPAGLGLRLVLACCLAQFVHTAYGSVVTIALPDIAGRLHAGMGALQWLQAAYILPLAALLTFSGTLADRWGRRRVLLCGTAIMTAGSLLCALSPSVWMLVAGRAVQGVGSAMVAPAGLSLLTAAAPKAGRAVAVMWWSTVGTASLAAAPILGGLLVRAAGWPSLFWAGVVLGVLTAVLVLVFVPESHSDAPERFDPLGQTLLTLGLAAVTFVLIEGPHLGWVSLAVLVAMVVAVAAGAGLVRSERDHPHPVVPLRLLRTRAFVVALTTAVLGYLALAGLLFVNTFALQSERGLDAIGAGLATIPLAAGATLSAVFAARLVGEGRSRPALMLAGTLIAAGSLALWATEHAPLWTVLVPSLVFGLGFGLIPDPISVTALAALDESEAGLASSLISTSKQVGQMLGVALVGMLLAVSATGDPAAEFDDMGGWVWMLLAVAGVVIVLVNGLEHRRARRQATGRGRA
ncbi:MFS transporter [Microbacterium luticocti]|uniref:MFS transporter n=1 Tax=Microbacterium luticocti TaxID=451764 RepID=UPI000428D89C|nr:MFS transporter [Microbacterium luticocti]